MGLPMGGEGDLLAGEAEMLSEWLDEEFVDEVDEIRGGAPGLAESASLFGTGDGGYDEFRVGTSKTIDGLFYIANPDDPLGALRELGEEGELDRTGVLKLIDD